MTSGVSTRSNRCGCFKADDGAKDAEIVKLSLSALTPLPGKLPVAVAVFTQSEADPVHVAFTCSLVTAKLSTPLFNIVSGSQISATICPFVKVGLVRKRSS